MKTYNRDGLPPGRYTVVVMPGDFNSNAAPPRLVEPSREAPGPRSKIPARYWSAATSGLAITVKAGSIRRPTSTLSRSRNPGSADKGERTVVRRPISTDGDLLRRLGFRRSSKSHGGKPLHPHIAVRDLGIAGVAVHVLRFFLGRERCLRRIVRRSHSGRQSRPLANDCQSEWRGIRPWG